MPDRLPALIFDLDGTLTDSKPGIVGCLRKMLDAWKMGDRGPLDRFVGPPADLWTMELLPHGSDEDRAALVRDYRACYDREGWKNNSVFAGVRELLIDLREQGFPLYVCTSKPEHAAVRILDLFELTRCSWLSMATSPSMPTTARCCCWPLCCASMRSTPTPPG